MNSIKRLIWTGILGGLSIASVSATAIPVHAAPTTREDSVPRVGQIYFSYDSNPDHRVETDQTFFDSGDYTVYGHFEYFDVTPPNTLTFYWLRNDSSDQVIPELPEEGRPFTPPSPDGVRTTPYLLGSRTNGKLTLVVELNGTEVARRDCYNE
jgi:hypothetical protein